jgi:hypothetical protein
VVLWQGMLIVLGCVVAGLVIGFLSMLLFLRKKVNDSIFNNKVGFTSTEPNKTSLASTFSNGVTKSDSTIAPLEVLVKNHKNSLNAENLKPNNGVNVSKDDTSSGQMNVSGAAQEDKSPQRAIPWTELVTPSSQRDNENPMTFEASVSNEPVVISQKNSTLDTGAENTKLPNVQRPAEITTQKDAQIEQKQKKESRSNLLLKSESNMTNSIPVLKGKNKSAKSVVSKPEIAKPESTFARENLPKSTESVPPASGIIEQKGPAVGEKPPGTIKSNLLTELETNLQIASMLWADKLIPFQTECWDANHGEFEPLLNNHHQELIQLYVDIGLANNIVWLATEIHHRSKELDESYIKLCAVIADSIKRMVPSLDKSNR